MDDYPWVQDVIAAGIAGGVPACSGFAAQGDRAIFTGHGTVSGVEGYDFLAGSKETLLPAGKDECPRGLTPCGEAKLAVTAEAPEAEQQPMRRLLGRKGY